MATASKPPSSWLWRPTLIVFTSNACVMIIELVAGRIIAPYVGVSLYTWTSVIGVILAGMSVGNFVGGKLADRIASRRTLGILFTLAGIGSLSVLLSVIIFGNYGLGIVPGLPSILRIVVFVAVIFFIPSTVLGTISPLVIKLTLENLNRTGNVVGNIYAASALGSIVGTFATGYFLISWFGTRAILVGVGITLIVLGLLLMEQGRNRRITAAASVLLVGATLVAPLGPALHDLCLRETNYFCIRVSDDPNHKNVKILMLDHLVHSYVSLDDPRRLIYPYEKIIAEVAQYLALGNDSLHTLFIGGGGYTFPRYMETVYPRSRNDVAEIDPGVTETAYQQLGLPRNTSIKTYNEDARTLLKEMPADRRYQLVLGDAFNDFSVPYHLTTREFNELVRSHMTDDGIYALNLIDATPQLFLRAFTRTLKQTFGYVYLIPTLKDWQQSAYNTYVVLASSQPIDTGRLRTLTGNDDVRDIDTWLVSDAQVQTLLQTGPQYVFTDDYVPVDNLLAPLFNR